MFEQLTIKNFKSITEQTMEFGRVNVVIGANGMGKSTLLEAIGLVAANSDLEIDLNKLSQAGIRVARPDLMRNSFLGKPTAKNIEIVLSGYGTSNRYIISPKDTDFVMSPWKVEIKQQKTNLSIFDNAKFIATLSKYEIYSPMLDALRGLSQASARFPLGLHGEDFDVILNMMPEDKKQEVVKYACECISWMDSVAYDENDVLRQAGLKLGRSKSHLFFRDKFMQKKMTMFSAENANEGALVILFYLTLLMSDKTPKFFAIDNIDTGLNPRLCRYLMKIIGKLAEKNDKQMIVTTHNPAFLDGMNLNDDSQRLFVVNRSDEGHTTIKRIKTKPASGDYKNRMKLSEMWMNGLLGGVPTNF
ncbi:MAG: AAA family ATPase [Holdemanella sp.]|nr:AAA family ATPase [Holdemanella sp.]